MNMTRLLIIGFVLFIISVCSDDQATIDGAIHIGEDEQPN